MIRKSEIIEAINSLDHDLTALSIKVHDLNEEVEGIKVKFVKSANSKKQLRDSSGKFIKKS